ncbi:hypothetical protein DZF91_33850 [Actinomadura logoneensis]|uniref:CU044_5270 family protein n=1 Tax=Actinomadura logoneensis TaxID=2293572 RepID=A0A372JBA4_9ACTN|nr:CU044_5270 family protein [Actinomadura logoneensis]RFU37250.1 hypothetical protein DZF91_33850 [Actinomadura logoneensis]
MEEIETVKRMFSEPGPSPSALAAGRERLARGTRGRTRRAGTFWAAGTALAVGAAAAAVAVAQVGLGSGDPGASRPHALRLSAAQEVLAGAARTADGQPLLTPRADQWVHYRFAGYDSKRKAHPVYRDEGWQRLDGLRDASLVGGRVVVSGPRSAGPEAATPLGAWRRLAALPTDPRKMLAALRDQPGLTPDAAASADERAFANAAELLWNSPLGAPPKVQAALYRALGTLPGIRVDRTPDAVGERAVGLGLPHTVQILFDPVTYRYLGDRMVSDGVRKGRPQPPAGMSEAKRKAWEAWAADPANRRVLPAGALVSSRLRTGVQLVGKPGER